MVQALADTEVESCIVSRSAWVCVDNLTPSSLIAHESATILAVMPGSSVSCTVWTRSAGFITPPRPDIVHPHDERYALHSRQHYIDHPVHVPARYNTHLAHSSRRRT